jgi:hypothetical protein
MDRWHRFLNQPAPAKPVAVSPAVSSNLSPQLVASAFSGVDSLMSSEFQLTGKYSSWNSPLIDTLRDSEDIYGVTAAPGYTPINLNTGIDLQRLNVTTGILISDSSYKWRIRYRDHNVRWSEWSDSTVFIAIATNVKELVENNVYINVYPNPSNGNMFVKYDLDDQEGIAEIRLTASDGKIMNTYNLSNTKGEIQVNCNSCITGNYILTLYINGEKQCSKELNINK